ncbi:3,4-dihydroxy-2-butanone-4-phosphate synthase [Myxococcota bacterium]|nr:3,4-dihydroxy-2-butanone-4-phosphate synthase [Myxococcota bacterium]
MTFDPMPQDPRERVRLAIDDVRGGRMVILVDDEDRENEGDLVMAAERVTPEAINFMATHGRGLICLPLTEERIDHLRLPMMVRDNTSRYTTAFTVSIEARRGVSTGISAADRAATVLAAVAEDARPEDLVSPGHVFPLRARDGGVLVRSGQTEGSVDLARLAGFKPAGVICEIMNEDGTMARLPELLQFAARHRLRILTVADLIAWRLQEERLIQLLAHSEVETLWGRFRVRVFGNAVNDLHYIALTLGEPGAGGWGDEPVVVRVHSSNVWGDAFGAFRRDGGILLHEALRAVSSAGRGVVLYILKPFGAHHLIRRLGDHAEAVESTDAVAVGPGGEPYPTALRDYGIGAQVLVELGVRKLRLLSGHGVVKIPGLEGFGLEVVEVVPPDRDDTRIPEVVAGGKAGDGFGGSNHGGARR